LSPHVDNVVPSPALPKSADVVIVGGGIIGCAAAWFLAKAGISVALCEKGRIGAEQSSRNWGFCRQQGRDSREVPLIKESLAIWRRMEAEMGADVGFRATGIAYLTKKPEEMAKYEAWLSLAKEHGLDTRLITRDEAKNMVSAHGDSWLGGLLTPSDGRAEPAKAAPALATAAMAKGATVHTGCAVRGFETQAGRISAAVTEAGSIRTNAVLLAGGAWSRLFLGNADIGFPQLKVLNSVLRTGPAPMITDGGLWTPEFALRRRDDGGYTVANGSMSIADIVPDSFRLFRTFLPALRMEGESIRLRFGRQFWNELMMPGRWSLDRQSPFERLRVLDPAPAKGFLDQAMAALREAYPEFSNVNVVESWAGYIDATPDAVPAISPIDSTPGLFIASGFSGHGFGIGPGAGKLAAEIVSGAPTCVDPTPFRFSRFTDGSRLHPETGV